MIHNNDIINIIECASKYPVINRVGVFGSYARGEQAAASDIDILYDYDKTNDNYILDILNYGEELLEKLNKLNIELDYVSYKGVMQSSNSKSRNNILSEVIWIYERR